MAIPEYPITRREQYLDAIATNDTSALPAEPITRTEQYLDAIARNGGGGSGGGSGGGVLVCTIDENGTLNHTWQEIHDAPFVCVVDVNSAGKAIYNLISVFSDGEYGIEMVKAVVKSDYSVTYHYEVAITDSPNGYPVMDMDGE